EPDRVREALETEELKGAFLREVDFRPTFNKWAGEHCCGFQIHITDRNVFRPFRATLAILSTLLKFYPEDFNWSDPPYEYVHDKLPIDVIVGDDRVRRDLEQGRSVLDMEKEWYGEVTNFIQKRSRFLLYPS
ncbi:MAG: DUF1343 domain-containing protein, partial [Desulfomonilaceae bacterium]